MSAFLDNLKKYLPLIELAANAGLLASGVGAPFEPLAAGIEQAINPLIQNIGTSTTANIVLAVYAAIIGVMTTLENTPGLPQATIDQAKAYIIAAQNGTATYVQSASGFNPANYAPVTPIA